MLSIQEASNQTEWNSFLASQQFRPFLQSWEMGEVYRDLGHQIMRLEIREGNTTVGICFGHVVPAKRGRHLSIPYGPVISCELSAVSYEQKWSILLQKLKDVALDWRCTFIRLSPFLPAAQNSKLMTHRSLVPSPLHLLAEHLWYLPLVEPDPWELTCHGKPTYQQSDTRKRTKEEIFKNMRATTRNLIRRAEKEGVTVEVSSDPLRDLHFFLTLHEETRKRHHFIPYTHDFFQAQIKHFLRSHVPSLQSPHCSLYLARYQEEVIAASIHMHMGGETSYHHGASALQHSKIPASTLLQWTAIQDALKRGDHLYNFWGVAPVGTQSKNLSEGAGLAGPAPAGHHSGKGWSLEGKTLGFPSRQKHPFAGVTLFKTGFGGKSLDLVHCMDLPLKPTYYLTRGFEIFRKWKRGF